MAEATARKKKNALRGKGGLLMGGLFALLVVAFVIDQKAPPPRDPDTAPPVSDYARLTSRDVTRVELKRPSGGFVLAKQGEKWAFESPKPYPANEKEVESWLKSLLEDATVGREIEGKPGDMASYGLDKPQAELVLTGRGGSRTLQVGKAFNPGGDAGSSSLFYAREPKDGRLFMLASTQASSIKDKKLEDLRDKRLLVIGEDKDVQSVSIQRPAGPLELARKDKENWELRQPFAAPADKFDVESLVGQLRSAEANSFVEDAAADLAKYGLDKPALTVRVTDKGGQHGVIFGKVSGENVYAARQGENAVMLVSKTTYEGLDKKPADLRERDLITLDTDKINSVELKNAHGTVRLQKVSKLGVEEWEIVGTADGKPKPAKADTVQTMLNSLTSPAHKHVEEAPKDLSKYGLDKPEITVTMNSGGSSSQVFLLGRKSPEGNYFAKGSPDAVFEVQPFVYADVNVKPAAFEADAKEKK